MVFEYKTILKTNYYLKLKSTSLFEIIKIFYIPKKYLQKDFARLNIVK